MTGIKSGWANRFQTLSCLENFLVFDQLLSRKGPNGQTMFSCFHYNLCLNPSKTEVIWLGSSRRLKGFPTDPVLISGSWITPSKQVRDLGVTIDSELTMISHVNKLLGICYFHIRQLRAIRRSLTVDAAHALVRSLIHSRLDYCNSVLVGLPDYMINRLQSVLRSAARLVLQLPKRSHALERMQAELHWLVYIYTDYTTQSVSYRTSVCMDWLHHTCQHD